MLIEDIRKILVIRNDGIGDMINSTPAIRILRNSYTDAQIYVLASKLNAEILLGNPDVDEVIIDSKNVTERVRLIQRLRRLNLDLVVVLRTSSWGNFIAYTSGAKHRLGRYRKALKRTLTHKDKREFPKETVHEVERNIRLVELFYSDYEKLESNAEDVIQIQKEKKVNRQKKEKTNKQVNQVLNLSNKEIKWAKKKLCQFDIKASDFLVGIHPGGSSYDKLWPVEKYAVIANRLRNRYGFRVIILHGEDEKELADVLSKEVEKSVVFAPESLRHLSALLKLCNLVICNDSGPMHIAAALNRPIVAVFGPTDHIRWTPLCKLAVVVRQEMPCWPCSAHKCSRNFECIKELSEDIVWQEIEKLLPSITEIY